MKLESILELWETDTVIDRTELSNEATKIPQLHHKYYKIFVNERLVLRKLEIELKELRLEKHEFYTQGPTRESEEKGWKLPPIGKIIKSEVNTYIDTDKDIIQLSLRIGIQHEKIDMLESIIKSISNRGFLIKNIIDWEKFKVGGY
jgi:hypothetical protein